MFKLTLTEDNPAIKSYNQDKWANLPDTLNSRVEVSLSILEAIHTKWILILKSLHQQDFERAILHPENGNITLERILGLYA